MCLVRRWSSHQLDFIKCAEVLSTVYSSDSTDRLSTPLLCNIPVFTCDEVRAALLRMAKNRCADKRGIVVEMFLHGGTCVHQYLASFFNGMIASRCFPAEWSVTHFTLLHKGGASEDPNNWRPIAILSVAYKILARVIFSRLERQLDVFQADEQFGFRPLRSVDHALLILECVVGKSLEWNIPIYVISVDLRNAFYRVEHVALFEALAGMGMCSEYINLLQLLYKDMSGVVGSQHYFPIRRGVR